MFVERAGSDHNSRAGERRTISAVASVLALAGAIGFMVDALAISSGGSADADRTIELAVHTHLSAGWTGLMLTLSALGQLPVVTVTGALLAVVLARRGVTRLGPLVPCSPLLASLIEVLLKHAFHRARPHLWQSAGTATGYSFPSGHATAIMGFTAMCCYLAWRLAGKRAATLITIALLPMSLGVGLSRIYLGVHWPTDVAGGYCIGLGTASLLTLASRPR